MSTMTWEISMRTNFTDRDKDEAAKHAVLKAARKLQVLMRFIADDFDPEISVTGNDFFAGKTQIDLYADIATVMDDEPDENEDTGVSADLMQALMAMRDEDKEKK